MYELVGSTDRALSTVTVLESLSLEWLEWCVCNELVGSTDRALSTVTVLESLANPGIQKPSEVCNGS